MNALLLLPVLFGGSCYYYHKKRHRICKSNNDALGMGLLLYVFLFSVLALVFYYHPDFIYSTHYGSGKTYILAVFYFYFLYILWLYPFLKGDYSGFDSIVCSPIARALITVVAISAFFEALMVLPHALSGYARIALDDINGVRAEELGNLGHGLSSIPVLIYSFWGSILPLAFFYYLATRVRWGELLFLAIASFLPPVLLTFATGSREHFVFPLIDSVIAYLIFYRFLSKKVKNAINISFFVLGGIILFYSVWMSLSRFYGHTEFDSSFWVFKYLGEGFVNFNTLMWPNLSEPCYGDFNFAYFRSLLGLSYSASNDIRREYWATRLNFPTNYFYTFIGSIVIDWGRFGGILLSLLFVKITHSFTKIGTNTILFSQLIILHFVACICAKGVFYFNYASITGGRTIMYVILLCLFLRLVGKT